jgi:hypothetical protein
MCSLLKGIDTFSAPLSRCEFFEALGTTISNRKHLSVFPFEVTRNTQTTVGKSETVLKKHVQQGWNGRLSQLTQSDELNQCNNYIDRADHRNMTP